MGTVMTEFSVSLDGYMAGPNDGPSNPLGDGGEALFTWMNAGPERNRVDRWLCPPDASKSIVDEWSSDTGAMVGGRRTFDIANGWKGGHPIDVPNFIVTHSPPTSGEWHPKIQFVPEGVERAVELAKATAGDLKVSVGASSIVQQVLQAGLLDEINLSITPVLLGGGVRLLDRVGPVQLEQVRVIESIGVTHVRYLVVR